MENFDRFRHKKWVRSLLENLERNANNVYLRDLSVHSPLFVGREHIRPNKWEAALGIYRRTEYDSAIIPELVGGVLAFPLKEEERQRKQPDIFVLDKKGIWITSSFFRTTIPWISALGEKQARQWQSVDGKKWKMFETFLPLSSAPPLLRKRLERKAFLRKPTKVPVTSIVVEHSNSKHTFFAIKQLNCGDSIVDHKGNEILRIQKNPWWRSLISWGPKFLGIDYLDTTRSAFSLHVLISILIMSFLACTTDEFYSSG